MTSPEQPRIITATLPNTMWAAINPPPGDLVIQSAGGQPLVTVSLVDGSVTYGPGYEPDEAARLFWEAIHRMHVTLLGWPLQQRVEAELAKGNEAIAAGARVRELHQPVESGAPCIPDHGVPVWCPGCAEVCATCRDEDGDRVPYPCPTLQAFDDTGEAS